VELEALEKAIQAYSDPAIAFDFENSRKLEFPTVREQRHIHANLWPAILCA
jgi:hypothetical protein